MFMPSFRVAVLLLLGTTSLFAQGSAADYERAGALRGLLPALPNESIEAHWLSNQRVIFRMQQSDTWQFTVADADGGRRPAFAHDRVATALADVLDREVLAARLPFARFHQEDERLLALIEEPLQVVAIDPDRGAVESVSLDATGVFSVQRASGRRSRDKGSDTSVRFENGTDAAVEVLWLDRSGRAEKYATLQPGERHQQHTFHGHLWLVRTLDGRELGVFEAGPKPGILLIRADEEGAPAVEQAAPAAKRIVVRDHNLHLQEGDASRPLSRDGTPEDRYTDTHALSPDGRFVLVVRETPEETHRIHLVEAAPADRVEPKLHSMQYLKPGDRIAGRYLTLIEVANGRQIDVSRDLLANAWSLNRMHWSADGDACYVVFNQRGHQVLRVLAVGTDGAVRTVVDETSETFIDYAGKFYLTHLEDENALLWMSERSGWNHLYRVDRASGATKAITRGDWLVRRVEHVDRKARTVTFQAMGVYPDQDPYHVHYGRVSLDGGPVTWLTEGDGMHTLTFSPDRSHYIDRYSRVDLPPVHELRRAADGGKIADLARCDASAYAALGWRAPERFVAKGRDGETDIWGLLFYPSNFDPKRTYPVIENIYAGPQSHFVPKSFRKWHGSRQLAELGFIVVRMDGMGTNWRSKAFHDVCWKNLGDSGFADRIAWIQAAAKDRPFMDLSRVGIYGGSAGGQSALRAVLAHGDFYHAAVADCGCHDNRMDKIWWNELWMGWPIGPHYAEQSNVTNAHRLKGELLLIVGAMDRNVDPSSTMQVVDALIKADKDFELLVMPSAGHGAAETAYGSRRRQDFFVRHLLGVMPRHSGVTTKTTGR